MTTDDPGGSGPGIEEAPAATRAEAERYGRVADRFAERVDSVDPGSWYRPSPCDGWDARDVIGHLVGWVPGMLCAGAGLDRPDLGALDRGEDTQHADDAQPAKADPATAWAGLDRWIRSILDDPALAGRPFDGPMGPMDLATAVGRFVTPDVLIHTWDLARAVGLDDRLDPAEVEGMVEAMEPYDDLLRQSGHYGPRVTVGHDADAQDRLLAFLGRDPAWTPPT